MQNQIIFFKMRNFKGEPFALHTGDFRRVLPLFESDSVPLMLTDPPYEARAVPLYAELAKNAARLLTNDGNLFAMVGSAHLPAIMNAMSQHLYFHWDIVLHMRGSRDFFRYRSIHIEHKLFLWFRKTKRPFSRTVRDFITSDESEKRFHSHGQPVHPFVEIIKQTTKKGDLIIDPFCGGGTTGIAAVQTGRRFIGIDKKKHNVDVSEARIRGAWNER